MCKIKQRGQYLYEQQKIGFAKEMEVRSAFNTGNKT